MERFRALRGDLAASLLLLLGSPPGCGPHTPRVAVAKLGWLGLSEAKPRSSRRRTNRAVVPMRSGLPHIHCSGGYAADSVGRYALTKIALQKSRPRPGGTGRMLLVDIGGDEIRGLAGPPDRRDPQRSLMRGLAGRYGVGAGTRGQLTDPGGVLL